MFQSQFNLSRAGAIADADALKAALVAAGYVVKLFKTGWAPTELSVGSDFDAHECDFTGYASQSVGGAGRLWSATGVDAEGNVGFSSPNCYFQATDGVAPNMVGGYWTEATLGDVRRYNVFPAAVDMNEALRFINLQIYESSEAAGYATVEN